MGGGGGGKFPKEIFKRNNLLGSLLENNVQVPVYTLKKVDKIVGHLPKSELVRIYMCLKRYLWPILYQ